MAESTSFRDETLGSNIVDVYVGPDRVHFSVHQKLLCQHASVFDKMFNGGFREAVKKSAELPEDGPKAFDSFLQWLYCHRLERVDLAVDIDSGCTSSGQLWDRIKLYCFAEKYCIDALADAAMDSIIDAHIVTHCGPAPEEICLVYDNTSQGSGLRLYMARRFAHQLGVMSTCDYTKAELGIFASKSDFSSDVFSILLEYQEETAEHPENAPRCDYHQHSKDGLCTRRKRRCSDD